MCCRWQLKYQLFETGTLARCAGSETLNSYPGLTGDKIGEFAGLLGSSVIVLPPYGTRSNACHPGHYQGRQGSRDGKAGAPLPCVYLSGELDPGEYRKGVLERRATGLYLKEEKTL